ncbi:hypothetical protein MBANPS3_011630 [Mucor bainieri]
MSQQNTQQSQQSIGFRSTTPDLVLGHVMRTRSDSQQVSASKPQAQSTVTRQSWKKANGTDQRTDLDRLVCLFTMVDSITGNAKNLFAFLGSDNNGSTQGELSKSTLFQNAVDYYAERGVTRTAKQIFDKTTDPINKRFPAAHEIMKQSAEGVLKHSHADEFGTASFKISCQHNLEYHDHVRIMSQAYSIT